MVARARLMNQLVPFHSGQAPVLIAAAGERARVRFVEFFLRKAPRGPAASNSAIISLEIYKAFNKFLRN